MNNAIFHGLDQICQTATWNSISTEFPNLFLLENISCDMKGFLSTSLLNYLSPLSLIFSSVTCWSSIIYLSFQGNTCLMKGRRWRREEETVIEEIFFKFFFNSSHITIICETATLPPFSCLFLESNVSNCRDVVQSSKWYSCCKCPIFIWNLYELKKQQHI